MNDKRKRIESLLREAGLPKSEKLLLFSSAQLGNLFYCAQKSINAEQYVELVDWISYVKINRNLSISTCVNYSRSVVHFMKWINKHYLSMDRVDSADIERWLQSFAIENNQKSMTLNVKLVAVRQYFEWRHHNGKSPNNPARNIKSPKRAFNTVRKYTNEQLRKILQSCDRSTPIGARDYSILIFLLATGARRAEVESLKLSQLMLSDKHGVVRLLGKGQKERCVSFEGEAVAAIREWLIHRDNIARSETDEVFVGMRTGAALRKSGLRCVITRAISRAKIKLSMGMALHTMRSTYATALYDSGIEIEEIRACLGHNDINTTRKYISVSNRRLKVRLPAAYFNEILGNKTKIPGYIEQHTNR